MVIEAMAQGLPVICLDCGGPAMAVREGCGIRVPLGSRSTVISHLAEAICFYDQNRDAVIQHGEAARRVIAAEYV